MSAAYVYILRSLRNHRVYIGVTGCIDARLDKHNSGRVQATCKDFPFQLVRSEVFDSLTLARHREKFFKSGDGRRVVKRIVLEWSAKKRGGLPKSAVLVGAAR